ncbi:pyruvate, phosphate dikinase [Mycobacterium avium]|nr:MULTISPECIES: pyruvate, phosphate dikinase [Mycobacterium avium complex (MAC)]MCA2292842.1 pyruvate, phosphate dikinase [Mycobacterium avium]
MHHSRTPAKARTDRILSEPTLDMVLLDGSSELDRELVGGKAWAINHMRRLGLAVPPAFTLDTSVCMRTLEQGVLPEAAISALKRGIAHLEAATQRNFGGTTRPLLVSVRSGAARSMPGMMDTVLNVGTNATTISALEVEAGRELAHDISQRFRTQFVHVVGSEAPQDPFAQVVAAATAVFRSWTSPRARTYRRHHGLSDQGGTAVTVQAMVFGNIDNLSGTGVLFSRNPLTGAPTVHGEWLPRAQGEDVVSGKVSPRPLSELAAAQPAVHRELVAAAARLERDAGDVQDIEFTVESGRLWLLQTRAAKRSAEATVRIALALWREEMITSDEALARIAPTDVAAMLRPRVAVEAARSAVVVASGQPACPGIGCGVMVATADEAVEQADAGRDVVLATPTTSPDDVHGMVASVAIVTELGGSTSHAAVVSRELGRPAVVGCGPGSLARLIGKEVTVDGGAGLVYAGLLPVVEPCSQNDPDLTQLASWAGANDINDLPALLTQKIPRSDGR